MNKETIKILVGIKMNQLRVLRDLEGAKIDLTSLTDRMSTDTENNDITDAIGLLIGNMDGMVVYEILAHCLRNYVDDNDKIVEYLIDNKDKTSFVTITRG